MSATARADSTEGWVALYEALARLWILRAIRVAISLAWATVLPGAVLAIVGLILELACTRVRRVLALVIAQGQTRAAILGITCG